MFVFECVQCVVVNGARTQRVVAARACAGKVRVRVVCVKGCVRKWGRCVLRGNGYSVCARCVCGGAQANAVRCQQRTRRHANETAPRRCCAPSRQPAHTRRCAHAYALEGMRTMLWRNATVWKQQMETELSVYRTITGMNLNTGGRQA